MRGCHARRRRVHVHCVDSRMEEEWPREYTRASGMLSMLYVYMARGKGRKGGCFTEYSHSASVWAAKPSLTNPYSTHSYILGNKRKKRCYVLTFDPAQRNAIPRWCTGRKWHISMASNRKRSRGRIKAYNMGQGEGPTVPIQTDAPEESNLWTAWQLFPLDDD